LLARDGPVALLGNRARLELAVAAGIADAAHDVAQVDFESIFSTPSARLIAFLQPFDRCVAFLRDNGEIAAALRACGIANVKTAPGLPPDDWPRHASEYYLDAVEANGVIPAEAGIQQTPASVVKNALDPRFRGGDDAGDLRGHLKRNCLQAPPLLPIPATGAKHDIVIHPGSGAKRKNWPADSFVELTRRLMHGRRAVEWILGPAEEEITRPAGVPLLNEPSLVVLAGALAASRLYIGNDSGITHLAAAVGCPTVAVFGPTNPATWAPPGAHVKVICGAPWPDVDAVQACARSVSP
jgi:hypothetical protein